MSILKEILHKSGLDLQNNGQGLLSVDPVVFVQNCSKNLKDHSRYPTIVDDFARELSELIEDTKQFRGILAPTTAVSDTGRTRQLDSLIRLLLKITDVQPKLCQILLEKAAELSEDVSVTTADSQIPKLILLQFRWLDTLTDSAGFCDKLLEVFPVLNIELQKDVISLVPEVIEDGNHMIIASAWSDLLKQNLELALPLLHSLTNLNVPKEILEEVQSTSMHLIESIQIGDVPALVNIILQNLSPDTALDVLQEMKSRLNSVFGSKSTSNASPGQTSTEVLILEAFQSFACYKKSMGDNILKLMDPEKNLDMDKFSSLDFFLVLMLMSIRSWQRKAELVFVKCINKELLTENIVDTAFKHHPRVCIKYFKSVQQIAEVLSRKSQISLRNFGGLMYHLCFSVLDDRTIAQQVIMNLIPHVRSGNATEIDGALDILLKLVDTDPRILSFGLYLKGLLDYIGTMSLPHVRKIYAVLGRISHGSQHAVERPLEDDLYIIVRKQLSHSSPKFRLMGVIGAVSDLKILVERENDEELPEAEYNSACDIVKMIETQLEKDLCARALFYDELSNLVLQGKIVSKFLKWLIERVANAFQDTCVVDHVEDKLLKIPGVKGSLQFELDKVDDGHERITLNLLAIATNNSNQMEVHSRCIDSLLASYFRLLQICESVNGENGLDDISALLGCSVYFLSEGYIDRFHMSSEKEKKFILKCTFTLINYFIELVNAFASQGDEDVRAKVFNRFKMIVSLRNRLAEFLPMVPSFVPYVVRPDVDDSAAVRVNPAATSSTEKKRKVKGGKIKSAKKRKRGGEDDNEPNATVSQTGRTQAESEEDSDDEQKQVKNNASKLNWKPYQVHFRELDIEVFYLLKADLLPSKYNLSQSKWHLSINELSFLFEDLLSKFKAVTEVIRTSAPKRGFPGLKGKLVESSVLHHNLLSRPQSIIITSLLTLLRFCRRHLDSLFIYMGLTPEVNATGESHQVIPNVSEAANLCLVILNVIEAGLDLASASKQQFSQAIKSLAPHGTDRSSQEDVIEASKMYLLELVQISPGLSFAVATLRCLQKCKSMYQELDVDLLEIAENILKRDWTETDRQLLPIKNPDIAHLLRVWLEAGENPLPLIENYLSNVLSPALDGDADTGNSLIQKKTLHVFCDVFYEKMIKRLETMSSRRKGKISDDVSDHQYSAWKSSISIFYELIGLIKTYDAFQILLTTLKHSRRFLSLFIRFGIPLLSERFRTKQEEILGIIKLLQKCTRTLQNVCSHSKISQNLTLTNRVPLLKKELESLLFQMKKMVVSNHCSHAFSIGNLKNRTLKGEEILSQSTDDDSPMDNERNKGEESADENVTEEKQSEIDDSEEDTGYRSECY